MPSSRGRRAPPPAPVQEDEDVDFEVSYSGDESGPERSGDGSEEGGSGSSSEEETDVEDGERSDEEGSESDSGSESEEGESFAEGCGPSVPARVPAGGAVAAATERAANTPTCPVCMEPWTSEGEHRISCIPCGHVYGRSCLERWLTQQRGNASATCPQCLRRFKHKDIINIYAPKVVVPNNDLEKQLLEKVESLAEVHILSCNEKFESLTEVEVLQEVAGEVQSVLFPAGRGRPPTPATPTVVSKRVTRRNKDGYCELALPIQPSRRKVSKVPKASAPAILQIEEMQRIGVEECQIDPAELSVERLQKSRPAQ